MADLKGQQLNQRYQTLLTTSVTTADPKTGILQNGDGSDILELTIDAGTNANNTLTIDKSGASGGNALSLQGAAGNINFAHTGQAITFSTAGTITATGSNDLNLVSAQRVTVDASHSDGLSVDANITCTSNISAGLSFLSLGSASAPSYSFTGDTNTGMFSSGADAIRLVTGGTSRLYIDSSGNVGIDVAPTAPFQLAKTGTAPSGTGNGYGLYITPATSGEVFIDSITGSGGNSSATLRTYNNGTYTKVISNASGNTTTFETAGTERLRIKSSGDISFRDTSANEAFYWDASTTRLGIGTTSPDKKLQINGSGTVARFTNGTSHMDFYSGSGLNEIATVSPLLLSVGGTERMRIDSSGNVGIGTSSIDGTLHLDAGTSSDLVIEKDDAGYASVRFHNGGSQVSYIQLDNSEDMVHYGGSGVNQIIYAGGSERMRIDASGNVGINTTGPTSLGGGAKLTVNQAADGNIVFARGGSTRQVQLGTTSTTGYINADNTSGGFTFNVNASERMRIDSAGNVGIGGTPASISGTARWLTLNADSGSSASGGIIHQVDGTTKGAQYVFGSNVYHDAKSGIGHQFAVNNGSNAMTINTSGNVGIGTTNPSTPLNVAGSSGGGSIKISGDMSAGAYYYGYMFDGSSLQGTTQTNIFYAGGAVKADTTITDFASLRIDAPSTAASNAVITNNYGIYQASTAQKNVFNGNVGIGTTPSSKLDVAGDVTLDNILLTTATLPAQNTPSINLRDTNNEIYFQAGSANVFNFMKSDYSTMLSLDGTNSATFAGTIDVNTASTGLPTIKLSHTNTGADNFEIKAGTTGVSNSGFSIRDVDASANRFIIDSSGNVGIGSAPTSLLQLEQSIVPRITLIKTGVLSWYLGNVLQGSDNNFTIGTDSGGNTNILTLDTSGRVGIGASPDSNLQIMNNDSSSYRFGFGGTSDVYLDTDNIYFRSDNGGTNYGLLKNGNLGLGTTDPDEPIHVAKSTGDAIIAVEANAGNAALYLTSAGSGKDNRIVSGNAKDLKFEAQVAGSGQGQGQDPTATGTTIMTLTNGGNLLINTTDSSPNITEEARLVAFNTSDGTRAAHFGVDSTSGSTIVMFTNPNGLVGFISTSGSATTYSTTSDYRLKENVVEMTGALDRIDQLKPSRFNFIADADTTVDGFLAHEVADVVPEAITGEKDAIDDEGNPMYQGIDQSKLVPLLVGAIQELRAEIEQLKNQ